MGSEGRILGPSGGFHSGVRLSGSASQRVCVSVVFFFISSSKLLVFVISSSIRSFSSELFSLLSSPQFFFCLWAATVSGLRVCPRASNQLYSILADGSLSSVNSCFSPHPTNTVGNYPHHRPRYYYHQRYRHHLQSSALFWSFDPSFFSKRSEKSEHSHFRSITGSIWLSRLSE